MLKWKEQKRPNSCSTIRFHMPELAARESWNKVLSNPSLADLAVAQIFFYEFSHPRPSFVTDTIDQYIPRTNR